MNRKEFISEILDLYDQLDELSQKSKESQSPACDTEDRVSSPAQDNRVLQYFLELGAKEFIHDCISTWRGVSISFNEDNLPTEIQSYESWVKNSIIRDRLPDNVTLGEILEFAEPYIKAVYEKQINDAIKERQKKESNG